MKHAWHTEVNNTLADYQNTADAFWAGTRDHDVSQNRQALLQAIQGPPPWHILDFGCGPGRDLKAFCQLGHQPTGLDGTTAFCAAARQYAGAEVWQQNFLALELPTERFDGVFANASLFHVPTAALPNTLKALHQSLRPGGVLLASNPRGANQEGWNGQRYGVWHDKQRWDEQVLAAGFSAIQHYYRPPGVPQAQQSWLVTLWRKA